MIKCTKCGAEHSDGSQFCSSCGAKLEIPKPLQFNDNVIAGDVDMSTHTNVVNNYNSTTNVYQSIETRTFKCKMCGQPLEVDAKKKVIICQHCDSPQVVPKIDDERRASMYDRANHFLRDKDFDKAMGLFEQILNEDNTDAEAYWSLVLCRYGIEYVKDPDSHKRIPTVHRVQYNSIFSDEDYKSALLYADDSQRAIYEAEARVINEIQKRILAISQKEEPFDIFICYKESDGNDRTPDSVLAQDLYDRLTYEGYKVFFSRITLADKAGEYEPYIFAALNSSKVMIVLGTKQEYFDAPWVKNEWRRFLKLRKEDPSREIIPVFKDMSPYDLPEEFSILQGQDMSKWGFNQDLLRTIKKIVQPKATKPAPADKSDPATTPLLKRMFIFLEEGDWTKANEYCERVLDQDPENANAYLGKLMIDLHIRVKEELSTCEESFDNNNNYKRAIRYGDEKLISFLQNQANAVRLREEQRKAEEARRLREAEERRKAEEARKLRESEERRKAEEARKLREAEERRKVEEARKLREAEERRKAEEARKLREAEERRKAEAARILRENFDIENGVLRKYKGKGGNVIIPNSVTSIGYNAFEGCTSLTSIDIPDSVTSINAGAFKDCTGLTSVTIPDSVTSLTSFTNKTIRGSVTSLTSETTPDSETSIVGTLQKMINSFDGLYIAGAFEGCTSLTSVTIGNGVTNIDSFAFLKCTNLTSIVIPDSVTRIGGGAFKGCTSLSSITIGNSVTSIGYNAFEGCSGLTSITIPDSVTSIGEGAFSGCANLTSITLPFIGGSATGTTSRSYPLFGYIFGKDSYTGGVETKQLYEITYETYYIPSALKKVTITGEKIPYFAFSGCTSLTSIVISDSVTSIDSFAFWNCTGLTSIDIPDSVTGIGINAFSDCKSLSSITIGNSVTSIGYNAFEGCSGLTSITIPDSVTSIGEGAFSGCANLTGITLPFVGDSTTGIIDYIPPSVKNVTITSGKIPDRAFKNCKNLTSVTIGNGVTSIVEEEFSGCTSLTHIVIPDSVVSIGQNAFKDCTSLTSIVIPDSVTSIDSSAFSGCSGLTSITIPDSVTSIGNHAFNGCTSLTSIAIPDSVTSIDVGTFRGCKSLTSIDIPDSVTEICLVAFENCTSLTSVTIGNSVKGIGKNAFKDCTSLTSVTIPNSVTSIGEEGFSDCTSLTHIVIPDSVVSIGKNAFKDCTSLTSVTIPNSVTSIGWCAFGGCTSLTSIVIPDSVTSIGNYAFENCTSLTSVTIGNGVTSIGYSAFENCVSLTSVTFKKSNDWRYLKWFLIRDFEIRISRRKLANDLTAAKYLRKKYREYKWKCRK